MRSPWSLIGHIAGVGAGVVATLSTFISVPFGALVGYRFDGTMYALIAAFGVFGAGTYAAMRWAEAGGGAGAQPGCRRSRVTVQSSAGCLRISQEPHYAPQLFRCAQRLMDSRNLAPRPPGGDH